MLPLDVLDDPCDRVRERELARAYVSAGRVRDGILVREGDDGRRLERGDEPRERSGEGTLGEVDGTFWASFQVGELAGSCRVAIDLDWVDDGGGGLGWRKQGGAELSRGHLSEWVRAVASEHGER